MVDISYLVAKYWEENIERYIEWFLWNYVQKYIGLTFCDWEATHNGTTECWGLAWIFRPLYAFWVLVFAMSLMFGWTITVLSLKTFYEQSGLIIEI